MRPLVLILALIAALGCGGRGAPLGTTTPLQAGVAAAYTERAILEAAAIRGWVVQERQAGAITLYLAPSGQALWVRVAYDARVVQVFYLASKGLDEERDGAIITVAPEVNGWIAALEADLSAALGRTPHAPPVAAPTVATRPSPAAATTAPAPPANPECKPNDDGSQSCGYGCRRGSNGYHFCSSVPGGVCTPKPDGTFACP